MELRQLQHFFAVVEERSFTRAAARLHMVQSSLSASLLSLERELGADLFVRGRRGAELTDAGRAFLDPAGAAVEETRRARDAVAEVVGLLLGSVHIATVGLPSGLDLLDAVGQFQSEHPNVDLHIAHHPARDVVRLVADGQVDFGIATSTYSMPRGLQFEPLMSTPLFLICSADHRLAGAPDVDPRELLHEQIIDFPLSWCIRELFDRVLAEQEVERKVRLEVSEWHTAVSMVRRAMGISYGALAFLDPDDTDIDYATLANGPLWEIGIVTRDRARGAAGKAFLDTYRQRCEAQLN